MAGRWSLTSCTKRVLVPQISLVGRRGMCASRTWVMAFVACVQGERSRQALQCCILFPLWLLWRTEWKRPPSKTGKPTWHMLRKRGEGSQHLFVRMIPISGSFVRPIYGNMGDGLWLGVPRDSNKSYNSIDEAGPGRLWSNARNDHFPATTLG